MSRSTDHNDRIAGETRAEIERTDWKVKVGLLVVSSLTIVFLVWAALAENVFARWRTLRGDYQEILADKAEDDFGRNLAGSFALDIDQNVLVATGEIDRCISCHAGIDDPRMKGEPQPFAAHPGSYVQIHEPAKFGCTICHEGQGRATTEADAHEEVSFWEYPLLERPYMKTGCTKCHSRQDLMGTTRLIEKADLGGEVSGGSALLDLGWRLMERDGCLGCHVLDGKGGNLGPDITGEGDKIPHEFAFAHVEHQHPPRPASWHREHFLDPKKVSPGSLMPDTDVTEIEARALTAVMLSLRSSVLELRHEGGPAAGEKSGGELYALYCSACHGESGAGDAIAEIPTPSLNNTEVLATADDDYLRRIILTGRRGTYMPGWGPGLGNLTAGEIDRVIGHIRGWQTEAARAEDVRASHGDPRIGKAYYQGLCASCHGAEGEGGIGISLNTPSFLSIASDRFLAESIIHGRPGTAMASWEILPSQAVADLVAHIRTWQAEPPSFASVVAERKAGSTRRLVSDGKRLYGLHCGSCHGQNGEGGVGLQLNSQGMLRAVDDRFLYTTMVKGRPGTAMPSWGHLGAPDIAAILAYLRSWQRGEPLTLSRDLPSGDHIAGEARYELSCQRCHGEKGSGGVGPQLTNPVFLGSVTDAQLFQWIGRGRPGTAMKGFLPEEQGPTRLNRQQISDVIAYLRYAERGGGIPIRRVGEGSPSVGAELYAGTCASCHGVHGEGASGPQLNNPRLLAAASDGFLAATIILGRQGTPMRSMVHGLQGLGQIEPDQVQDVVAYLRQWEDPGAWRPPARFVDITGPAIRAGRELFAGFCSGCHGPAGRGVLDGPFHYAPALNNQDFLAAASDGFLLATIARGRRGTPMRPFGEGAGGIVSMKPQEITDVVSFIRSWQTGTPGIQSHASGGQVP